MSDLRQQLQEIYNQNRKLTPEIVLQQARDEEHPLHARFEWDDSIAAEKWRREQAHELICSVKISYRSIDGEKREIRKYHAFRASDGQHHYQPLDDVVVEDDTLTKILRNEMERDWKTLKSRYDHFVEFYRMVRNDMKDAA